MKEQQTEPLPNAFRYCKDCLRKFIVKASIGKDGFLRCNACHKDNAEQSGYKPPKKSGFYEFGKW
jgi:hypothetical protein